MAAVKDRSDRILSCAVQVALGVTAEGYRDILSIAVEVNETSKLWSLCEVSSSCTRAGFHHSYSSAPAKATKLSWISFMAFLMFLLS